MKRDLQVREPQAPAADVPKEELHCLEPQTNKIQSRQKGLRYGLVRNEFPQKSRLRVKKC
eukprot:3750338-Amphidinium_carterae.1